MGWWRLSVEIGYYIEAVKVIDRTPFICRDPSFFTEFDFFYHSENRAAMMGDDAWGECTMLLMGASSGVHNALLLWSTVKGNFGFLLVLI